MRSPYVILARKIVALDMLGGVCAECGTDERLEFDHIADDRGKDGRKAISQLIREARLPVIVAELEKCQLLCHDCHTKKTMRTFHDDKDWVPGVINHGRYHSYLKLGCRCNLCHEAYKEVGRKNLRAFRERQKKAISVSKGVQV